MRSPPSCSDTGGMTVTSLWERACLFTFVCVQLPISPIPKEKRPYRQPLPCLPRTQVQDRVALPQRERAPCRLSSVFLHKREWGQQKIRLATKATFDSLRSPSPFLKSFQRACLLLSKAQGRGQLYSSRAHGFPSYLFVYFPGFLFRDLAWRVH